MNQKEGVVAAIVSVLGGEISGKVSLNDHQQDEVERMLVHGFMTGQIEIKGGRDETNLNKCVPGLINNWLRKDTRLNGGDEYVTKRPGSRAGAGDEQLKAMKALLA